jgi:hypothetical protein
MKTVSLSWKGREKGLPEINIQENERWRHEWIQLIVSRLVTRVSLTSLFKTNAYSVDTSRNHEQKDSVLTDWVCIWDEETSCHECHVFGSERNKIATSQRMILSELLELNISTMVTFESVFEFFQMMHSLLLLVCVSRSFPFKKWCSEDWPHHPQSSFEIGTSLLRSLCWSRRLSLQMMVYHFDLQSDEDKCKWLVL